MTDDPIIAKLRAIFRSEAQELLEELESSLLELETVGQDAGLIDRVFRSLHTLKGSGATSGYAELSEFLHEVESVYSQIRDGHIEVDSELIDATLQIKDLVDRYLAGAEEALSSETGALEKLRERMVADHPEGGSADTEKADLEDPTKTFRIRFAPHPEFFHFGHDPLTYLDDLKALGECRIEANPDKIPPLDALDAETAYLSWEIELQGETNQSAIEDCFAFAIDECYLEIETLHNEKADLQEPDQAEAVSEPEPQDWILTFDTGADASFDNQALHALLDELSTLGQVDIVSQPSPDSNAQLVGSWALNLKSANATESALFDAFLFSPVKPKIEKKQSAAAPPPKESSEGKSTEVKTVSKESETLKVASDKIDLFVDMVGELVILKSQLSSACKSLSQLPPELESASEGLERLTLSLRDLALDVRTTPIGDTFDRFKRLCRDLSRDLGKQIRLEIEGGETCVDKSVIDCLKDPLVHLIRNCIDHGIETPEQRTDLGKPPEGTIRLSAEQNGDYVRIEIADDGKGIDVARVRAKAIQNGLLQEGQEISDDEALQLIFQPGLSTAKSISQISGRGVGLDAVRKQIERLRGTVELRSAPGKGSTFELSLPLTLAIIEGLLVQIEEDQYVIPLNAVQETIELTQEQREAGNQRNLVELRQKMVPFLSLRPVFGYTSKRPDIEKVVIVEIEGQRLGLVVDEVIGNHQTVLKSLGWASNRNRVFSGSTVLGNGRIGLICDIARIVALAAEDGN